MKRYTITNSDSQSIALKDYKVASTEYRLLTDNIAPLETSPVTRKGYKQDGNSLQYSRANHREITLSGLITGSGFADMFEKGRIIKGILNPRMNDDNTLFTLKYENDYWTKEIDVYIDVEPVISYNKNYQTDIFNVRMIANNPFFKDVDYTSISLSGITSGFYWGDTSSPTYFDNSTPFYFGQLSGTSNIAINNGDVPAPLEIEWTGAATDPKITLDDTGEFILLNRTLLSTEKLIITTGYNNKNAFIEDTTTGIITKDNSIIDKTSTLFSLPRGNSTLSFSATSGTGLVDIKYKQLWIGV